MARRTPTATLSICLLFGLAGCHADKLGTTHDPATAGSGHATSTPTGAHRGAGEGAGGDARDYAYADAEVPMAEAEAMAPSSAGAYQTESRERRPQRRRSLGTEYGEQYYSAVRSVGFQRRSTQPEHVFQLWYDDADGVYGAARAIGWSNPRWTEAAVADSGLSVRLLNERGRTLRGARVGDKTYAVGDLGQRYTIGVYNDTGARQEVVASVDGLDVITGDDAHFGKRGYVIEPYSSVQIDGWRTSESNVAAFRFSAVESSYASRTGRPRNVGVIGVAFFSEAPQYTPPPPSYDPWRDYANPFPAN